MKTHDERTRHSLTVCAGVIAGLAVLAALPVLSMLAVATRALAFGAMLVLLAGAVVAYPLCPSMRQWLRAKIHGQTDHKGLRLDGDVALDPHHSWVQERAGVAVVGVDDLLQAALGPVDAVEIPTPGSQVTRGERLVRLQHGSRSLELPSPVSGVVFHRNETLQEHPELVNNDPYGLGWMVTISSAQLHKERRGLLRGQSATRWFRSEIDRLITVLSGSEPQLAVAMADGGTVVDGLHRHIDDEQWQRVKTTFFEGPCSSFESERS